MVCARCEKLQKTTHLATPGVKRKNDIYLGSPTAASTASGKTKSSATLGSTGVTKVSSKAIPLQKPCLTMADRASS